MPPTTAPAPWAPRIVPQAVAPPSDSFEITAPRTRNGALMVMLETDATVTVAHSQLRHQNSCHPRRNWARKDVEVVSGTGPRRRAASEQTLRTYERASARIAQPGLDAATMTPATAGPMIAPIENVSPLSAFACVRRSLETIWGMSPVSDGMKKAVPVPTSAGRRRKPQKGGCPRRIQAPSAVSAEARSTSAASMTWRRPNLSPATPPMSRKATSGTVWAASTTPTSDADA